MEYRELGNTGIKVSRLCFGGLTIGPMQANLSIDKGADVIVKAFELGVNFIDTAEIYGTYPHLRKAIKTVQDKPVIATKSYAWNAKAAGESLEKARRELDVDFIDVFLMHEQESELTLKGHREALEYYISAKEKGLIKAVGVSTHNIEVVKACSVMPGIDVIHPIVNRNGLGIRDGSINGMLGAIKTAYENKKGIYSMKPLGGGNLLGSFGESIGFVLDVPYIHSVALGMQSVEEVIMNVNIFCNKEIPTEVKELVNKKGRKLHIDPWCEGCGKCLKRCGQGALFTKGGKARVSEKKCILCGYCGSVCPVFAIKIF